MTKPISKDVNFWDRIAYKYSLSPIAKPEIYEKKLALTRQHFKPEMRVLEFGCGTGSTAILHSPYVKHITATDFSQKMIGIAKQKAVEQNIQNISFECLSLMDLDENQEPYDMILGLNVLHLLDDKEVALSKVFRLLKPDGIFVSSTACLQEDLFLRLLKYVAPLGRFLGLLPLFKVFSKTELIQLHEKIGFCNEAIWSPDSNSIFIIARKRN